MLYKEYSATRRFLEQAIQSSDDRKVRRSLTMSVNDLTAAGNPKAHPRKKVGEWILHWWAQLDPEIIKRSFKSCALTCAIDGSQGNTIHCFKPDQPCHAGLEKLQSLTDVITAARANPFADISIAVNGKDDAEVESDSSRLTEDSSSDAEDIDIEN